jgi:hypothetical protein
MALLGGLAIGGFGAIGAATNDGPAPAVIGADAALEPADLENAVVRFTNSILSESVGSPDPNNGVRLQGEHWIIYDAKGQPVELRSVFRREDGSVAQSQVMTPEGSHAASDVPIGVGHLGDEVYEVDTETPNGALDRALPAPIALEDLARLGYAETAVASAPPLARIEAFTDVSASPRAVVSSGDGSRFERQILHDGGHTEMVYVRDAATGIPVYTRATTFDSDGEVLNLLETSVGDIEVFNAADLPIELGGSK